ncbi:MAG: host attachment protein [Hyphomicrobium sp.]|jgi:protein required for attachment to host cells
MKATRTWILIADGSRARILEQRGPETKVRPVEGEKYETESKPSRELGSDRPGRVVESVGHQHHAVEPKYDLHRGLETMFANQLADILSHRLREGLYDRLIMIAPPAMLGDLRKSIPRPVQEVVVAELAKDLTKIPNDELMGHLGDMLRL